jgi:signal transduction histidine kinase
MNKERAIMTKSSDLRTAAQESLGTINADLETALADIRHMIAASRTVNNAEELASLEREISHLTNRLAGLMVGQNLQEPLTSSSVQTDTAFLVKAQPKRYKNQG